MTELDKTILEMSMVVTAMQVEVDNWVNHLDNESTDGMKVGYDWYYSTLNICKRALALLKVQEPVTVIPAIKKNDELLTEGSCPICGAKLDYYLNGQFCGYCGSRIKWE